MVSALYDAQTANHRYFGSALMMNRGTQQVDVRIMSPSIGTDGQIHIPGIIRGIPIAEYRPMVALFSRILEAKALIERHTDQLRLAQNELTSNQLTPLVPSSLTPNLLYKREDLTATRAYKLRGAFVAMAKQMEFHKQRFLAVSTGNHALGVLKAAELLKPESVRIVVPHNTAACKLQRIHSKTEDLLAAGIQAEVVFYGDSFDEARNWVKSQEGTDEYYLDPYSDPWVIAGQGTIGLELFEQLKTALAEKPEITEIAVIAPVGGGGLLGGLGTGLKMAAAWDSAFRSVNVRLLGLRLNSMDSLLGDAIKVNEPAAVNRQLFSSLSVGVQQMGDVEMAAGVEFIQQDLGVTLEGASGGTVFPAQHHQNFAPSPNRLVVSVLSGGNVLIQ